MEFDPRHHPIQEPASRAPTLVCECGGSTFVARLVVSADVHVSPDERSLDLVGVHPSVIDTAEFRCEECGATCASSTVEGPTAMTQVLTEVGDDLVNLLVVGAVDLSR